ncbi:WecB/TagA/CpsF family glycosyltransferase [Coleofasciculus sp. E1-EBD-02]|uniref:WecB/TagA/CpsF family glycosyltransferase n=1 Tax=Coleofasciculus sp. E1-EBD-02 TaxID=3068481 RepID=UPI0032F627A3
MQNQTSITGKSLTQLGTVNIFGVPLLAASEIDCAKLIMAEINSGHGGWCVTVNLDILRQITTNPDVKKLIENSNLFTADGISLVLASWLRGTPLPERVCGCNLIYSLTEQAAQSGRSVFLLGGNPDTAQKAAEILKQRYPGLIVAGTYYPPFGFEQDSQQIEAMVQLIRSAQPDIVYVALGFPKQEKLIKQIRHACPNAWWIGIGISFSYVCGEFQRAPLWVQRLALETFYRVTLEPRRLAKRYLVIGPPFAARLLISSLLERFSIGKAHSIPCSRLVD